MPRFIKQIKDGKQEFTRCREALEKTPSPVLLHPHHGLCFAFFEGKGYSSEFTKNLAHVRKDLQENNPDIRLTCGSDPVCSACPNNKGGQCASAQKVEAYDRDVLSACNLGEGDILPYASFSEAVHDKILKAGRRREICGDCQWDEICSAHALHTES